MKIAFYASPIQPQPTIKIVSTLGSHWLEIEYENGGEVVFHSPSAAQCERLKEAWLAMWDEPAAEPTEEQIERTMRMWGCDRDRAIRRLKAGPAQDGEFYRRGREARQRGEPREYEPSEIDGTTGRHLMKTEFAQGWDFEDLLRGAIHPEDGQPLTYQEEREDREERERQDGGLADELDDVGEALKAAGFGPEVYEKEPGK
jgi:hypothetical protein